MLYLLVYIIKHTTDEAFFSNSPARRVNNFDCKLETRFKAAVEGQNKPTKAKMETEVKVSRECHYWPSRVVMVANKN